MHSQVSYTQLALERGRFTSIPNALLQDSNLTPQERLTWILVAQHQWGSREASWPGVSRIAEMLGVHEDTARRYLRELETKGYMKVTPRPGTTNIYELTYVDNPVENPGPSSDGDARGCSPAGGTPCTAAGGTPCSPAGGRIQGEEYKGKNTILLSASADATAIKVVKRLNELTGWSFKPTSKHTLENLRARLKGGATLDDCILVVEHKVSQWLHDDKMRDYLRPKTLFGVKKFDGYLAAAQAWDRAGRPSTNGKGRPKQAARGHNWGRGSGYYDQVVIGGGGE